MQAQWDKLEDALKSAQTANDRSGVSKIHNSIGNVYMMLGDKYFNVSEYQKALESYNQALKSFDEASAVDREAVARNGKALALLGICKVYSSLGDGQGGRKYCMESLAVFQSILVGDERLNDRAREAVELSNIGSVYSELNESQKALDYYEMALAMNRAMGNLEGEAHVLNNIGIVNFGAVAPKKALDFYMIALTCYYQLDDRFGEATTLNNIGTVYRDLGEKQRALVYYNRAMSTYRDAGDRAGEAYTLDNVGNVYSDLNENQKALDSYSHALYLATGTGDPLVEAMIMENLMRGERAAQPSLAVYFGKRAVDLVQQVRRNLLGLDKELQKSFLVSKNGYYRDLADLLIDQGRLPEAQQVLDLLKEQEYSDYTRSEIAKTGSPLTLTPAEKQAEEDYQKSTAQLVALGEQWAQLQKLTSRTEEQEKQYQQLSHQLDAASAGLNDYYDRLYVLFGKNSEANKQVADVKGDVSLLEDQIAEMPHTAALYTMIGSDRYRVIVITAAATVAREYAISDKDLNKKVADFQQVLRDRKQDPRPQAQELYKILIGPVKADLDQAQAETLVWSLDGVLRYVPMAALYDGKQYMVENYNTVTITPASKAHLAEQPDVSRMSVAAMGISRKYEDGLPALPAVVGELNDVVKDSQVQAAHGVMPGSILLDNQFTEKAMENELDGQHAVVHIASHFVFKPGDDSQSYLLLAGRDEGGAGYHLTVADFRDNKKLALRHTDLLTLSACETGMSGSASNGREVDGLGTTAQLKGAKAVISSLWEVNDASTGELMADFYQRWAAGEGKVTKVEALRQAQLDLLLGKVKPGPGGRGRGVGFDIPEAPASFAHPYYWAPFVLMGNWK
jgi:CHAT domain-containing protein/tetratricopeptide (TPR) repeat protein